MLLPEPDDARRALGAVVGAFGGRDGLDPLQAEILADVATQVYGFAGGIDSVEALTADEFLAGGPPAGLERHVGHLLVLLELAAHPLPVTTAQGIERYAHAIGYHGTLMLSLIHI